MSTTTKDTSSATNNGHSAEIIPFPLDVSRSQVDSYRQQYLAQEIAKREARALLAGADSPDLTMYASTLADELAAPAAVKCWAVKSLASAGSIVTLPSSRKTGKTTYLGNLAWCGADGESFLEAFETFLDGTVAVVNAEMGTEDYLEPYRKLGIRKTDRIRLLHCRDNGIRLNLMNDVTVERFIAWLKTIEAQWLFLDPWKNFLAWSGTGLSDNDAVNLLATRIQEIQAEAGLSLVVIPVHTTQTPQEAGWERAKGAGELEDSADALWRYTRSKGDRNSPRVLSVEGRGGAGLDETTVLFDEATRRLTLGQGNRKTAEAERVSLAVQVYLKEHPDSSGVQIEMALKAIGHPRDKVREALGTLRATGIVATTPGPHNATLHHVA